MRVARALVVATAALAVLPAFAPGLSALRAQTEADKSRIDDQIQSLQEQVNEASAEEGRLLGLIDESTARLSDLDGKVAGFDAEIAVVQGDLDAAELRLASLEAEQHRTETRLAEASAQLAAAKETLAQQAIAAYTGQSEAARYAGMLLGAGSLDELAHRRSYLKAVVGSQSEVIAEHERLRDQVGDLKRQLERSRVEAVGQRDVVAGERDRLGSARAAQASVRDDAAAEVAQREQLKSAVVARKEEYQAEVEQLEAESAAIAETLRRRAAERAAAGAPLPALPPGSGQLMFPIPGGAITSGFGYRIHPIYGDARLHTGIDIGADTGDPIYAAADGVVASVGSLGGYGNATVVEHGGGLATLYGHQSSILVSDGESVTQGQVIGRVGCTGACTGPHLHFEVRVDGDPVDPMGYL